MIARPEDWQQLWDVIDEEFSRSAEKGLSVVFSTQEVETVCAMKMLQVGLKVRDVHFSTYPVEDYTQLRTTLNTLLTGSNELRTVFVINCGAGAFIKDFAPPSASNVRYVVVDSHRPVHPKYNDQQDTDCFLFLAPDDPQQLEEIPVRHEFDDITEEEREILEQEAERERQEEEELDRDSPSPAKRRKLEQQQDKQQHRQQLRQLKERVKLVREYFDMGSSYGKPTPLVMQPLAEVLTGKVDNTLLWPACVGLTDQWLHQRLSLQHYSIWYQQLKDAVASNDVNQAHTNQANNIGKMSSGLPVISAERDYKLFLPRHWTLFDSFIYSPYVAPRLQTWRRAGEDSVALVLAHMGISKEQAQTPWASMQRSAHTRLKEGLSTALGKTSLLYSELATEGFVMHHNRQVTAASDVVHAVTALLTEHALQEGQTDRQTAAAFWTAVEAVDVSSNSGYKQLQRGIEMAKLLQQAVIRDGGLLVTDHRMVINGMCHIQEFLLHISPPTNAREFRHPLTLLRLVQFVWMATKNARKAANKPTPNYPVLAVGPEDSQGYCLVIGCRATLLPNKPQYNVFGRTFRELLDEQGQDFDWDHNREAFDSAVIYVRKNSVHNFIFSIRSILKEAADKVQQATQQQSQQQQETQQQQQQPRPSGSDTSTSSESEGGQDGGGAAVVSDADSLLAATDADADMHDVTGVNVVAASDDEGEGEAENLEDDM